MTKFGIDLMMLSQSVIAAKARIYFDFDGRNMASRFCGNDDR
jgi:hypothetical protein